MAVNSENLQSNKETVSEEGARPEEESLAEYASGALRGPRFGIFEQLLCQHLVQATVTTDSLKKVQLITEAALMLDEEKQKSLEIDTNKVEIVKSVCDALQHKVSTPVKNYLRPIVTVNFGFLETEENYRKYIEPWRPEAMRYCPDYVSESFGRRYVRWYCSLCHNEVANSIKGKFAIDGENCKYCGADLKNNYYDFQAIYHSQGYKAKDDAPNWQTFFGFCQALTEDGYISLETSFLRWSIPFVMNLMHKLTEAVRPEIYNEIARMFIEAKRELQK